MCEKYVKTDVPTVLLTHRLFIMQTDCYESNFQKHIFTLYTTIIVVYGTSEKVQVPWKNKYTD